MTLADLDILLERLERTAVEFLVRDGRHIPMAFIVCPGWTILSTTLRRLDEATKDRLRAEFERWAREGAVAFALITEAWIALGPQATAWLETGQSLASYVDRQEALVFSFSGACPTGQLLRMRLILRSPEGVRVGPLMALPENGALSSRFFDGLPWTPLQAATA